MLADDGVRFIEGGDSIGELPGDVDDPKLAAPIALTNPLSQMSMLRTQPVVGGDAPLSRVNIVLPANRLDVFTDTPLSEIV